MSDKRLPVRTINTVCKAWGVPVNHKFYSPDGVVVAALLANAGAKFLSGSCDDDFCADYDLQDDFYGMKSILVEYAAWVHPLAWKKEGVAYFETCVGQLSFHVFNGEDDLLPERPDREWHGGWMQDNAKSLALSFINDSDDFLEYRCRRFLEITQGY